MKTISAKLALLVLLLVFIVGEINATNEIEKAQPPRGYRPTHKPCDENGDCKGGVYCVCDKGCCYCSSPKQLLDDTHLFSKT
ncbi:hypothetical protein LINPERPRIM_LOCUS23580, partial [Linum perenne]